MLDFHIFTYGYASFRFLWPCIVSKVWREKNQQDATIRCLLLTSISTCFGHHYAHLQENKGPVTAFGVLFWFCWMWLVAVVGRCLVGCEHYEGFCSTVWGPYNLPQCWYHSTRLQNVTFQKICSLNIHHHQNPKSQTSDSFLSPWHV